MADSRRNERRRRPRRTPRVSLEEREAAEQAAAEQAAAEQAAAEQAGVEQTGVEQTLADQAESEESAGQSPWEQSADLSAQSAASAVPESVETPVSADYPSGDYQSYEDLSSEPSEDKESDRSHRTSRVDREQRSTGKGKRKSNKRKKSSRGRRPETSRANTGTGISRRKALRRRWVALLSVLAVLVGIYLVFFTSLLGVRSVIVTGVNSVAAQQVRDAAAIPDHRALFRIDTDEIRDRVRKLPGIASAEVSRSWPSTVEIKVVERVAIGYFERGDGIHLVDGEGVDFQTAKGKPSGLPQLKLATITSTDPSTHAVTAVLAAMPQQLRGQVVSAGAATPASVELELNNGKRVRWGGLEQTDRKAKILVALLTRKGSDYDVSSPELPTVS